MAPPASWVCYLPLGFHAETQLVAIKISDLKVTHTVGIVLRLIQDSGAARFQLLVESVNVSYEHVDCTLSGLSLGVVGGLKMN